MSVKFLKVHELVFTYEVKCISIVAKQNFYEVCANEYVKHGPTCNSIMPLLVVAGSTWFQPLKNFQFHVSNILYWVSD